MSKRIRHSAPFLLAVAVLSGCTTDESLEVRPEEVLRNIHSFERGRRAELQNDYRTAEKEYNALIERSNRYGDYGRAMLQIKREPGNRESVRFLLDCAERSDHSFKFSFTPDSAMDSAFSAAAMAKLSEIAKTNHDRRDIADSLREKMSDIVTEEVKAWANAMKTNHADSAMIYEDVISAVESCRQSSKYEKILGWDEISKVLLNEEPDNVAQPDGGGKPVTPSPPPYSVVKFSSVLGATRKYVFEVRLNGNGTFKDTSRVESDLRCLLMNKFLAENPHDGGDDVRILVNYGQLETKITGTADVVRVSGVRLEYDDTTGRGKIAVRLDGRNVSAAKEWARKHIEELASDKNIVLVAGKPPPPGVRYKVGSERMTEDGLLEIEFTTRPNDEE